ncbi:hypothetical protein [Paracoccus laeviglucosivorans]|uniref:DUF2125 domain-containing protein n=1 Tax=Paracoccus laeviglucosivorans TaxID=1197861 RepID=A0A521AZQ3_9RHOB|nr:hypothetical protein [Paracoccus laeviglucosivorans]SMO40317.1 hypothetical protein SAMN06265221_10212 [Paracoccus laeviglucosivorans]
MLDRYTTTALLALMPIPALAVPATDAGAERLTQIFQSYLGTTEGVIAVTPAGDFYDMSIDPAPLVAKLPEDKLTLEMKPIAYRLQDNGDGTWNVSEEQDFSVSIKIKDVQDQTITLHSRSSGIWDESLGTFRENKGELTNMVTETIQYQPATGSLDDAGNWIEPAPDAAPVIVSRDSQTTESMTYENRAAAGTAGGVDIDGSFAARGLVQNMQIYPGGDQEAPIHVGFTSPAYDGAVKIDELQSKGLLALAAWFVARPSEALIKEGQNDLRAQLTSALPLWNDMAIDATMHDSTVDTPIGRFAMEEMSIDFGLSGLISDAKFGQRVGLRNLTLPEGLAPDWSLPLIPSQLDLDLQLDGLDLAAASKMLIESYDLNAEDPLGTLDAPAMQQATFPKGHITFSLKDGKITGQDYNVIASGQMNSPLTPGGSPEGTARIAATGLAKIEAALAAAPPEETAQPLTMLRMARAMAKPGTTEGEQIWEIQALGTGEVKVNGMALRGPSQP